MKTGEKLDVLAQRIEAAADLLLELRAENSTLKQENAQLRSKLTALKQEIRKLNVTRSDRSTTIREKLRSVLVRLEELEQLQA